MIKEVGAYMYTDTHPTRLVCSGRGTPRALRTYTVKDRGRTEDRESAVEDARDA